MTIRRYIRKQFTMLSSLKSPYFNTPINLV